MGECVAIVEKIGRSGLLLPKSGWEWAFFLEKWVRLCYCCRKMGRSGWLLSNSG